MSKSRICKATFSNFSGSRSFCTSREAFPDLLFKVQTILNSKRRDDFLRRLLVNDFIATEIAYLNIEAWKDYIKQNDKGVKIDVDKLVNRYILGFIKAMIDEDNRQQLIYVRNVVDDFCILNPFPFVR